MLGHAGHLGSDAGNYLKDDGGKEHQADAGKHSPGGLDAAGGCVKNGGEGKDHIQQ